MKIYMARQITGLSYDEVQAAYKKTKEQLSKGYEVYNPMSCKSHLQGEKKFCEQGYNFPSSTGHAICNRDRWMVSQVDVLFADFSGTERVSIGMTMELAWASLLGKHTVIVLPKGNVHEHAFINESADIVFETYDEAIHYLLELAGVL